MPLKHSRFEDRSANKINEMKILLAILKTDFTKCSSNGRTDGLSMLSPKGPMKGIRVCTQEVGFFFHLLRLDTFDHTSYKIINYTEHSL